MSPLIEQRKLNGPAGEIAVRIQGQPSGPPVLMTHSILSSSMMWEVQAGLLAACGWRVIRVDTRGHGGSGMTADPASQPGSMKDLVADSIAVLDALHIERAHYVGLSLGGMSGFGLGIHHPERVLSLCLCDARADMPAALAAVWDERMALAQAQGCGPLAESTTERWFGKAFVDANPQTAKDFRHAIQSTNPAGFVDCAQAIQTLDYLDQVHRISVPVTLIAGANDGVFPQVMKDLQGLIKGARLEIIPNAGHLPNIDQPTAFGAAMMRHFFQNPQWSQA